MSEPSPDSGGTDDPDGEDGESLADKSIRGVVWMVADRGGTSVISILVHVALARLLIPRHFGLVAMARVAIEFLNLLKDQGFEEALIQRSDLDRAHVDSALWTLLGVGALLTTLGMVGAPYLAWFFDEPSLTWVFRALLFNVPIVAATSVPTALLKRRMRFKVLSLRSLFAVFIGGLVGVGLAAAGFGVWSLVGKNVASTVVGAVVLWRAVEWSPRASFSLQHTRALFSFGANVTAERILNYFNRQFDDLIIGRVLGSTALGYYSVAYEILKGLTSLLSRTVSEVALPAFSRLQDRRDELLEAYYSALKLVSYVAFPVFALYIVLAPELFDLVYGPKWSESVPVAQVLGGIGILHSVLLLNPPVMKACGKPSWELAITVLNSTLNIVGFIIAVQYGITAVAAAYVLRGYLTLPAPLLAVRSLIGLEMGRYLRLLSVPIAGCLVTVAGVYAFKWVVWTAFPTPLRFGLFLVAGAAVYLAFLQVVLPDPIWSWVGELRERLATDDEG